MSTLTKTTKTNDVSPTRNGRGVQDIIPDNTSSSPIGIDTVRIHVDDFTVDNTAGFRIVENSDYSTGETESIPLWEASDGTVITGDKAVLNTPVFQVTVRGIHFMSVQASLPKLLRDDNLRPAATPGQVEKALTTLNRQLEERGIHCRLSSKPLGRIDICRNVCTDTPLADLEPFLKRLDAPYLGPRDNGHDGVKWVSLQGGGSSEREVTFYSKSEGADLPDPNIQRLEYRLQRKRAVQSKLGTCTTDDLCQSLSGVRSTFRGIVQELFPDSNGGNSGDGSSGGAATPASSDNTSGDSSPITSSDIRDLLRKIRSEHGDNCHALSRAVWPLLLAIHPDPDHIADAVERAAASEDGPSGGKYQVRRKIREARVQAQELSDDLRTSGERLRALRAKLLS
jgi:hypothetical protein